MLKIRRDRIIDYKFENTPFSKKALYELISTDVYASIIYRNEREKILIENYLDASLPDFKMKYLEEKLDKDPSLKKEFELRKKMNDALKHISLIESLDKIHEKFEKKNKNKVLTVAYKTDSTIKRKRIIRWAAAASIIILFSLGSILMFSKINERPEDKLFAKYYKPLSLNQTTRTFIAISSALLEARDKYQEKDYRSAYVIFRNLPDKIDIRSEKNFFIGLILIEMGQYENAIQYFRTASTDNFEFLPETYWYLGLCYLKIGQTEKAIDNFEYLVNGSSYKSHEAKRILRDLK